MNPPAAENMPDQTPAAPLSVNAIREWIKLAGDAGVLAAKLALVLGVLITLGYCWLVIQFFPSGLTIGDALFFFAVALSFGLLHLLVCGMGFVIVDGVLRIAALASPRLRQFAYAASEQPQVDEAKWMKGFERILHVALWLVALAGLVLITLLAGGWITLVLLMSGVVLWFATVVARMSTVPASTKRLAVLIIAVAGLVLIPLGGFPLLRWQVDTVMETYALKGKNRTLRLSDENHATLAAAAHVWQIPVQQCEGAGAPGSKVVHGVDLVWHGLGERSLVAIADPKEPQRSAIVELKREGVFAIRGPRRAAVNCAAAQSP